MVDATEDCEEVIGRQGEPTVRLESDAHTLFRGIGYDPFHHSEVGLEVLPAVCTSVEQPRDPQRLRVIDHPLVAGGSLVRALVQVGVNDEHGGTQPVVLSSLPHTGCVLETAVGVDANVEEDGDVGVARGGDVLAGSLKGPIGKWSSRAADRKVHACFNPPRARNGRGHHRGRLGRRGRPVACLGQCHRCQVLRSAHQH